MTIEWRYTTHTGLGVLSLAGYLGPDAIDRFNGAIGWVLARGTGPVILDLTALHGWSLGGQLAIGQAAQRLADEDRGLELAAIPAEVPFVPDGSHPAIPLHLDLPSALAAHPALAGQPRQWRSDQWPDPVAPKAAAQGLV
ncbi:STAS domain-containing protein [Streptomyces albipurpureus]|uniref:STAS domain-containing protein n=1 Tax=Streptomyces albipurpureus TaxID=2897419 RepID=A0ABT0USD4_9ACTN|nr:STAS domain-containing protein [Streptomyces sp. CWNU-1]MCM2390535.1 STAS domain-containing protein [Streptomyces sp. CWNU-1]